MLRWESCNCSVFCVVSLDSITFHKSKPDAFPYATVLFSMFLVKHFEWAMFCVIGKLVVHL